MRIPLVDLAQQSQALKADVLQRMERAIDRAQFVLGPEVEEFEKKFAAYCQCPYAVAVANGTEALHLALRALGIGPGDEVITAANSFVATALAIVYCGARPVLVDVCPDDYTLDPKWVEAAITPRTKAIIPVHLYGQPARMDEILAIASRHGLYVVEDAAQAHGAEIAGKRCGSFGNLGCFSFYPGKNLGAWGDGGAIVTHDRELAERLYALRNYGQRKKYVHEMLGFNCRLDTLQACVLLAKMERIEQWTEQRRQVATWYREALTDSGVRLPVEREGVRHVYHLFVVQHEQRDGLLNHLHHRGIGAAIHYPYPLTTVDALGDFREVPAGVPNTAAAARRIISLPMYPEMTKEVVYEVADAVRAFQLAEASS